MEKKDNDSNKGKGIYDYDIDDLLSNDDEKGQFFFLNNVDSIVNYAGTILKTIKMIYLENFYNCSQIFRKHFMITL